MLNELIRFEQLDAETEKELVKVVSNTIRLAEKDGSLRYYPTEAQHVAMERLVASYLPDIRRAAKRAKAMTRDEAESVALEAFVTVARTPGNRKNDRLAGYVGRVMDNAVMDADAEQVGPVRIPADTLRRYMNLIKEHGSLEEAYEASKTTANQFVPQTVLAVNRTLNSESIEGIQEFVQNNEDEDGDLVALGITPSFEDELVQSDLIEYLFEQITEEQQIICRLAYGFVDDKTEARRLKAGHAGDELLSDKQIAPIVGASSSHVNRTRNASLKSMKAILVEMTEAEEDSLESLM